MQLNEMKNPRNTTAWISVKTSFFDWILKHIAGSNLKIVAMSSRPGKPVPLIYDISSKTHQC